MQKETEKPTTQPDLRCWFVLYGDDSDRVADPEAAWLYAIEAALVAFGLPFVTVRVGDPIPSPPGSKQRTIVFYSRNNPAPREKYDIGFYSYESAIRFVAQLVLNGVVAARPASSPIVFVTNFKFVFDSLANWVFVVQSLAHQLGLKYHTVDASGQDEPDLTEPISSDAVIIAPYEDVVPEAVRHAAGGLITNATSALQFVLAQAGIATVPSTEEEEEAAL